MLENALSVGANIVIPVVVLFACAWNSSPTFVALNKLNNVPNCPAPSIICVMFTGAGIDAGAGAAMRRGKLARLRLSQKVRGKEIREQNECEGFSIAELRRQICQL